MTFKSKMAANLKVTVRQFLALYSLLFMIGSNEGYPHAELSDSHKNYVSCRFCSCRSCSSSSPFIISVPNRQLLIWIGWVRNLTVVIATALIAAVICAVNRYELMRQGELSVANWSAFPIPEFPTMANGGRMLQQIVMDLAICDVVCPFQMVIQCVVIRREADCALFLHFVPPGSPCLLTSNTCVFIIDFGQDKCFHIWSFDFVS